MTDRLRLDQHTDDTLTELYDQLANLRVMYDAASEREHDLINERDQLRAVLERTQNRAADLATERDQHAAQLAAARDLHTRNPHSGTCEHCSENDYPDYAVTFPCPTIRALDTALAGLAQPPAADAGPTVADVQHMLTRMRSDAATDSLNGLLRIVSEWVREADTHGGMQAGSLTRRLEHAGYRLPDPDTEGSAPC